jgi:hypothetical protein
MIMDTINNDSQTVQDDSRHVKQRTDDSYTVLAIGAQSVVALHSISDFARDEAINRLKDLHYYGKHNTLKEAGYVKTELPEDRGYLYIFNTRKEHELSFTTIAMAGAEHSPITIPISSADMKVPYCLVGMLAPTAWGKTTFTEAMARSNATNWKQTIVRFTEPNAHTEYIKDGVDEYGVNYHTVQTPFFLLIDMLTRLYGPSESVVHYDSFRYFVYAQGLGGTGERGMDMLFPTQLTSVSNIFSAFKQVGFATINPRVKLGIQAENERYSRLSDDFAGPMDTVIIGGEGFLRCTVYSRSNDKRSGVECTLNIDRLEAAHSQRTSPVNSAVNLETEMEIINLEGHVSRSSLGALMSMTRMAQDGPFMGMKNTNK